MNNRMFPTDKTAEMIRAGERLLVAGAEEALDALPKGRWIGGTIPYFMDKSGGLMDTERVFVTRLPDEATESKAVVYDAGNVDRVAAEAPDHGFTMIIVPAFSQIHRLFAENAPEYRDMFMKPILGWISGVRVEDIGKVAPKVYLGETGEKFENRAVAMHVTLDPSVTAKIDIVNLFRPGSGPTLQFDETSFGATECRIDGRPANLARYIKESGVDTRLPLVADFCGAMINTSIQNVDEERGTTSFYAPVFPGVAYRFADPVGDYATEFERHVPKGADMVFSCNCILNYLYGNLEGKTLAGTTGPITFGEIAYQLLNQTMVYLELEKAS
jgi:hypothetical protein